jgi:hypothetical protein
MQVWRLEKKLEKEICEYADAMGLLHIKMNLWGNNGWPDRCFFPKGHNAFFIEFKRSENDEPRKLQVYRHQELVKRGYHVYTCYSAGQAIKVIHSEAISETQY